MAGNEITWDELHPETQRLLTRRGFIGRAGQSMAAVGLIGGFFLAGCGSDKKTAATTTTAAAGAKKLYDRLGGNPAITAVIADFVDNNVAKDARINKFFANTDLTKLKKLLVEQVAAGTGGPEKYTGRSMKESHAGLKIGVADFNALVEDLVKSLDKFKVPEAEKTELLNVLGPMKGDIVTV